MQLLIQIGMGAAVGAFAYCFINPLIGWWLERYRGIKTARAIVPRELVVAALIGIAAFMASFMGPLKSGGLLHAYNDLCITLAPDALSGVLGDDYAQTDTGQYLEGAHRDNCLWAE